MALFKRKNKNTVTTKQVIVCNENKQKNNEIVDNFINAQKEMFKVFELGKAYHIKVLIDKKWTVNDFEDGQILRYWINDDRYDDCVIVKENGDSIIREYNEYSIVIALDCVKTAFLFKTDNRV